MDIGEAKGLSQAQAEQLANKFGLNQVQGSNISSWQILKRQVNSAFVYLLLGAAILSFGLKEPTNGLMILLFIIINAGLGFYQEHKSEHTVRLLKNFLTPKVKVKRDGRIKIIDSVNLVPGDIILLQAGDMLPADVRFVLGQNLLIDESVLTGESFPVKKSTEPDKNLGWSGTTIIEGKAEALVLLTGKKTSIGKLTELTLETKRESGFAKALKKLSQLILYLVSVTLVLALAARLMIKPGSTDLAETILFAIALAVSVIPEALPVVMTFALSKGALQLAKNKVVVKRLSAIEDLGGIEVLCTDKTGTITENQLTVAQVNSEKEAETMLLAAASGYILADEKPPAVNNFDRAIWTSNQNSLEKIKAFKKIREIPFDPQRRRDTVLVENKGKFKLIVRGAPELLMSFSQNINGAKKRQLNQWISNEGRLGRRVLGIAAKDVERAEFNLNQDDQDLEFLGLISFTDPVKKSTVEAVKQAKALGVEIIILTGDRPEVAETVAREIGLIGATEKSITGDEWEKLTGEKKVEALEHCRVFSRVSPQQKYSIIQLLQERKTVGFLGEGMNDAPALKVANVALAVQGAADIAREAADIVILNKSLLVIINGVKIGREVFSNTIKYIKTTLTSNFGNFYALVAASLLIDYLPMLPLQILLLNLLSDFPMIAIATDTVDSHELMKAQKYQIKDLALFSLIVGFVSTVFDFILFGLFVRLGVGVLRTNWFIGSILTELVLIFSLRTRLISFKARRPSLILTGLAVAAAMITIGLPYSGFGQKAFEFIPPTPWQLLTIFGIGGAYFITTEAVKLIYYRNR